MTKHTVSSVFVLKNINGKWKVLLVEHKKLNRWVIPGGHIEPNESPIEAAKREVLEETSINQLNFISFLHKIHSDFYDSSWSLPPEYCYIETIPKSKKEDKHKHIDFLFIAISQNTTIKENTIETTGIKWFSSEELDDIAIFPMTKHFAKQIIEKLSNKETPSYGIINQI